LIPVLEPALLIALVAINPMTAEPETRASRLAPMILAILLAGGNFVALGLLVHQLADSSVKSDGNMLLASIFLEMPGLPSAR
jgi:hypothetical protein